MSRWTDLVGGVYKWTDIALLKVKAGRTYLTSTNVGRKDILEPYPAVRQELIDSLRNLRTAGMLLLVHASYSAQLTIESLMHRHAN